MKKTLSLLLTVLCTISLCGCGLIPEVNLTDEETKLVAEYAAGLLLKYEGQHNNGLMEITDDPIIIETPEPEPEVFDHNLPDDEEDSAVYTSGENVQELTAQPELSSAIGIPDFLVSYTGYETCDFYPEQESDDLVFSMQAQQGCDLLVLHFDLYNSSDSAKECDVVSNAPMFRALINGDQRINAQTTILLNDLSVYQDKIEAGASVDAVLVFEIEESLTDTLQTISLLLVGDENDYTYPLQ